MRVRGSGKLQVGRAGSIFSLAALVLLAVFSSPASAGTGGAPTPAGAAPPPGSSAGAPSAEPSSGTLSRLAAETAPRKSFFFGYRYPRLGYTLGSSQPQNDVRIDVVDAAGEIVRNGRYSFRVSPQTPIAPAARDPLPELEKWDRYS